MRIPALVIFSFFLCWSFAFSGETLPAPPKILTLPQAYELSLKRSEDVAMRHEMLEEAQGRFYKAMGVILPKADFVMTYERQDASSPGSADSSDDGVSSSFTRRSTREKKFVFSQPVFSGFKELAALRAAGAEKNQRRHEWKRAREILFWDLVEVFYAVIETKKDLEILDSTRQSLEDRAAEIERRLEIGRSRQGELGSTIVEIKLIEFERQKTLRMHRVSRQLLEFYIGVPWDGELEEESIPADLLKEIGEYLPKVEERGDVLAAEAAKALGENNVVAARSGLFPQVKLDGNYYTERQGFQSGIDWDVLLTVDIPIFDGAQTWGNIKEAAAKSKSAEFALSKARRTARLELQNAYEEFRASRFEEEALQQAAEASEKNYALESEDYRKNLVSHLEVLDALRSHQDISRRLNQARQETKKAYWRFRVALGEIL